MNGAASIDFSAQFGGRDAGAAVLPHFKSLKKAARETPLSDFPFPNLTYILRVDGEVRTYGFRGAANRVQRVITEAIQSSVLLLTKHPDKRLRQLDGELLSTALRILCENYARHLAEG